jgi:hypothetical protein
LASLARTPQELHVALAQVGVREALAGDAEQAGADVQAGRDRAALVSQLEGEPGPDRATDVTLYMT